MIGIMMTHRRSQRTRLPPSKQIKQTSSSSLFFFNGGALTVPLAGRPRFLLPKVASAGLTSILSSMLGKQAWCDVPARSAPRETETGTPTSCESCVFLLLWDGSRVMRSTVESEAFEVRVWRWGRAGLSIGETERRSSGLSMGNQGEEGRINQEIGSIRSVKENPSPRSNRGTWKWTVFRCDKALFVLLVISCQNPWVGTFGLVELECWEWEARLLQYYYYYYPSPDFSKSNFPPLWLTCHYYSQVPISFSNYPSFFPSVDFYLKFNVFSSPFLKP